jgi:hypothetical protein
MKRYPALQSALRPSNGVRDAYHQVSGPVEKSRLKASYRQPFSLADLLGVGFIVQLFRLFFFHFRRGAFEISDRLSHAGADFRQFSSSENDQNNDQYDKKFRHSNSKHNFLLGFGSYGANPSDS